MNVALMLESDGPGGAETIFYRMADELRRRGHDVLAIIPSRGIGWLGDKLDELGIEKVGFRLRSSIDIGYVRELRGLLIRRQVEVFHSHEFTALVYGAAALRGTSIRHVSTMHGSMTMAKAWRRRVALRWALRRACSVAVSQATLAQLQADLSLPDGVLQVIPNGVPFRPGDRARVRTELGIGPLDMAVLAVGNLDPRKAHRDLLEALVQTDASIRPNWHLVVAGGRGGPEHGPLLERAREAGVADRVHVLLSRSDVPDLLAAADLFVMPSLWEGMPLALLEAMRAGLPCVATDVSGIPEAIRHGIDGLLVQPSHVNELSSALRSLMADSALRCRLGLQAKRRADAEFSIEAMTTRYTDLYGA